MIKRCGKCDRRLLISDKDNNLCSKCLEDEKVELIKEMICNEKE